MFVTPLKAMATHAMEKTLDVDYPVERFRGVHVSIEFPDDRQHYPGIWVDFEPTGEMERAGIGHFEYEGGADGGRRYTRWRFQGYLTYTAVGMTSLERDMLLDELIRIIAFGEENPATNEFRALMEDNDLIACNIDFDQVGLRGSTQSPGTPWGTEEMIYEATVAIEVIGEFVSDTVSATLLPLGSIAVTAYSDQESDPDPTF